MVRFKSIHYWFNFIFCCKHCKTISNGHDNVVTLLLAHLCLTDFFQNFISWLRNASKRKVKLDISKWNNRRGFLVILVSLTALEPGHRRWKEQNVQKCDKKVFILPHWMAKKMIVLCLGVSIIEFSFLMRQKKLLRDTQPLSKAS